jgi:flagellar motor switch protein FliG
MSSLDQKTGKKEDDEIQRIFDEIAEEKPMSNEEIRRNYGHLLDQIIHDAAGNAAGRYKQK